MLRWLRRLLARNKPEWLRRIDETDPIPLRERPVDWDQRHAGRTVQELLDRQHRNEIIPPKRPN